MATGQFHGWLPNANNIALSRVAAFAIAALTLARTEVRGDEPLQPLKAGRYTLKIMTDAAPEDQRIISIPVVVTAAREADQAWRFELSTDKEWGNPFKATGLIDGKTIKVGFTAPERKTLITYYFEGETISGTGANGSFKCIVDGKAAFEGSWSVAERTEKAEAKNSEK